MSTVYVVTAGEYSDYHIKGVFSTSELADQFVQWRNGKGDAPVSYGDECQIEPYDLDTEVVKDTGYYWWCGTVEQAITGTQPSESTLYPHAGWNPDGDPNRPAKARVSAVYDVSPKDTIIVEGYGPTLEHARRSATELARAIKAGTVVL